MIYKNLKRANAAGFTLVELLVVIAIMGILASIVVPSVSRYMAKARIANAESEIRNADLALAAMLADSGKARFRDFLTPQGRLILAGMSAVSSMAEYQAVQAFYNEFFYDLLRNGQFANFPYIESSVRSKLGDGYMQLDKDPWDAQYRFWMGPQPRRYGDIMFRSYRIPPGGDLLVSGDYFEWNQTNWVSFSSDLPGQPPVDNLPGYPADRTRPVYIYSTGANQLVDAFITIGQIYDEPDFFGGGDDINNWDTQQGWNDAPK
jgi:prepilin-type N-terminal cleavage/methylation domain-containing protein